MVRKPQKGDANQGCQRDTSGDLADRMAHEHGVSRRTIFRAAEFARAIDYLDANENAGLQDRINRGESVSHKDIIRRYRDAIGKPPQKARRVGLDAAVSNLGRSLGRIINQWPEGHEHVLARILRECADLLEADAEVSP